MRNISDLWHYIVQASREPTLWPPYFPLRLHEQTNKQVRCPSTHHPRCECESCETDDSEF